MENVFFIKTDMDKSQPAASEREREREREREKRHKERKVVRHVGLVKCAQHDADTAKSVEMLIIHGNNDDQVRRLL